MRPWSRPHMQQASAGLTSLAQLPAQASSISRHLRRTVRQQLSTYLMSMSPAAPAAVAQLALLLHKSEAVPTVHPGSPRMALLSVAAAAVQPISPAAACE